jgi:hypothetical protein
MGTVRHRSEVVEYRVEQRFERLGDQLIRLRSDTKIVRKRQRPADKQRPTHTEVQAGQGDERMGPARLERATSCSGGTGGRAGHRSTSAVTRLFTSSSGVERSQSPASLHHSAAPFFPGARAAPVGYIRPLLEPGSVERVHGGWESKPPPGGGG